MERVDYAYERERKVMSVKYEYEIQGNYGYGWDTLTTEDTLKLAREQLITYGNNEDIPLRVKRVKEGE